VRINRKNLLGFVYRGVSAAHRIPAQGAFGGEDEIDEVVGRYDNT